MKVTHIIIFGNEQKTFSQLCDHNWVRNFAFLIDVTEQTKYTSIYRKTNNLVDGTETIGLS
jgi:hypothetical protein